MGGVVTEEKAISHDQYLDLVYSQSKMLYELIPQTPCTSTDPAKTPIETTIDGVVGSLQPSSTTKLAKEPNASTIAPSNPMAFAEVNVIQSS